VVDLKDFIVKIDIKGRKTRRYLISCNTCGNKRYDMKSRSDRLCRKCVSMHNRIQQCRDLATSNGGFLLSDIWVSSTFKYSWKCGRCANEWNTQYYVVARGSWCSRCSNSDMAAAKRIKNILYCQKLALSNHGLFLSTEYKNDATKYLWQCNKEHRWSTRLTVVEGGSWCPRCFVEDSAIRKHENDMRCILESYFNKSFPSIRPDWLINPTSGYPLELDCFNEELGLAFEYDGELHDKDVAFFNNISSKQRERDIIKDRLCKEHNITLIRISYKDKKQLKKSVLEALDGLV